MLQRVLPPPEPRVLVVAARDAWPMYKPLSVYRCSTDKPMRLFQPSDHIGFYTKGAIQPLVPRIKLVIENIDMRQQEAIKSLDDHQKGLAEELRKTIGRLNRWHEFNGRFKIMFLTGPDDDETVNRKEPIKNDKQGKSEKLVPFTYGARYVTLESLKSARKTSELKSC